MPAKVYKIGRRTLTIWFAGPDGKLTMTGRHKPLPHLTSSDWEKEQKRILTQEGFKVE